MNRKLPKDDELSALLKDNTNATIASMFNCSPAAVSLHRKRFGIPAPSLPKTCCRCGKGHPDVGFHRDRSRADGLSAYCKACQVDKNRNYRHKNKEKSRTHSAWKYENNRQQYINAAKNNYAVNKDRHIENKLKRNYGITLDDYNALLEQQNGRCAICGTETARSSSKRLFVDHCHKTGKVRGLLCGNCNSLLGHAKDRCDILSNAKDYLTSRGAG